MTQMLVTLGALCVVAAAVGGGFKWAGAELPALRSISRQFLVAVVGVGLGFAGINFPAPDDEASVAADGTAGASSSSSSSSTTKPTLDVDIGKVDPRLFAREATISLSPSSGAPGTTFLVSGSGFQAGERVEIRFHNTVLGDPQAGPRGEFEDFRAKVPQSLSRNVQRTVTATGQSSDREASQPFQVL